MEPIFAYIQLSEDQDSQRSTMEGEGVHKTLYLSEVL